MVLFLFSGFYLFVFFSKFDSLTTLTLHRNKPLAVIGGGDSAAEEAICMRKNIFFPPLWLIVHAYSSDLTKYGSHIYVLVRRGELKASKIMAKRLLNHPKIVSLSPFSLTYHIVESVSFFSKNPDSIVEHCCDRMPRRRRFTQQRPY